MTDNPFATSEEPPNDDFVVVPDRPGHLASRWRRLGGALIDWTVLTALWLPIDRLITGQWMWNAFAAGFEEGWAKPPPRRAMA